MSTRAITFLEKNKIPFQLVRYEHKEKGAVFASDAVGFPLEKTIKTLVVKIGETYTLALMPGDQKLNMKRIAQAFSVKQAEMADVSSAERITGYLTGGISPFGCKKNLPVLMEASLLRHDTVMINAGQRGTMLVMSPHDIVKALNCRVLELVS